MKKFLFVSALVLLSALLCIGASASSEELTIDSVELANGTLNMTLSCPETMVGDELTVKTLTTNDVKYKGDAQISYINQYTIESSDISLSLGLKEELKNDFQIITVGGTDIDDPISCTAVYGKVGDADSNGSITAGDAATVLQYVAKILATPEEDTVENAVVDVNGDDALTAGDAAVILQFVAKIISADETDIDTVQTFVFYHN